MKGNKELEKLDIYNTIINYSVYIFLVILIVFFTIKSPMFLSKANISNFFSQLPAVGILCLATTMILIAGYVDLSIASVAAFSGTLSVYLAVQGFNPVVVVLVGLLVGAAWGAVNAFLITRFNLIPFILTLGTNYIVRGLLLYKTNGINISGLPDWFYEIANTRLLSGYISSNTVIFIILVFLFAFIMKQTRFGRECYAVGSNPEAARLTGIKTNMHAIKVFVFEGMVAALAGILMMSNLNVGSPAEGQGMDLIAMAGAIMGGTWFGGGVGSIGGAIAGVLTIQVFRNGLSIMNVNSFLQQVVTGAIIVLAIVIDYFRRKSPGGK